ncbi:MAG: lytic transglycosylase domain-containing protein [Cyanobacteria bacterium]|nr:lytic transglycosylase domain-containing protein [Cyanobacteriota bacterium]
MLRFPFVIKACIKTRKARCFLLALGLLCAFSENVSVHAAAPQTFEIHHKIVNGERVTEISSTGMHSSGMHSTGYQVHSWQERTKKSTKAALPVLIDGIGAEKNEPAFVMAATAVLPAVVVPPPSPKTIPRNPNIPAILVTRSANGTISIKENPQAYASVIQPGLYNPIRLPSLNNSWGVQRNLTTLTQYILNYNKSLPWYEVQTVAQSILWASDRYGVDYRLMASMIAVESSFRRDAVSSAGAMGLGQLKPDTARWLGVANPFDPLDNVSGMARYLSFLMNKYQGSMEHVVSAYYQGQGSVDRNGITDICQPYLARVSQMLDRFRS